MSDRPIYHVVCCECGLTPEQLDEYVEAAHEMGVTPEEYVRREEGTYNPENGHFCCTECYIKIGMPSTGVAFGGWKAP